MFHNIPKPILEQMAALEAQDAQDRIDGTPAHKRLRQIPPHTGQFLALLAASAPPGLCIELGASAGYSGLWLSLAMALRGGKLVTFELLPEKVEMARKTFKKAKVEHLIELVHGDARGHVNLYDEIAFCFMDTEKEMYSELYDLVTPRLLPGGLLLADNLISHAEALAGFLAHVQADMRVDSVVVPIGSGVLLCRKRAS
ncbi:MAG: class I SAM-dependent methyltransferase [Chloroflexi bacterium]|nr:class I SAM-dependent methyltransferase [Chloroflexota bacterium]